MEKKLAPTKGENEFMLRIILIKLSCLCCTGSGVIKKLRVGPSHAELPAVIKDLLLVSKKDDDLAVRAKNALSTIAQQRGLNVVEPELDELDAHGNSHKADLVICIGGDGTFLSTLRKLGPLRHEAKILGVHGSRGLGFLHPLRMPQPDEDADLWATQIFDALLSDQFDLEDWWGLEARIEGKDKNWHWALNDFVVGRSSISRMVDLELQVDNDILVPQLKGDGMIVSSSTGSTAYSLSAGGPVLDPLIRSILVTPICSHTMMIRPMVLKHKKVLKIRRLDDNTESLLTADGQEAKALGHGETVEIRCSPKSIQIVKPNSKECSSPSYLEVLRSKLGFGKDRHAK